MQESPVSRRAVLATGAGLCAGFAGCISTGATPPDNADGEAGGGDVDVPTLRAGGSSTVYPIVDTAASYWGNERTVLTFRSVRDQHERAPRGLLGRVVRVRDDPERGSADRGTSETQPLGDGPRKPPERAARHRQFERLRESGVPRPRRRGTLEVHRSRRRRRRPADRGERGDRRGGRRRDLGRDAESAIYAGEITDQRSVPGYDGPEKQIQAVGRTEGSGTDTAFRNNLFSDPNAPIPGVDIRKGQNQQVWGIVTNADNAIAYMALAFVDDPVPSIGLTVEGTEYVPGENLAEGGYPLARDLHRYTWDGTSEREAAFLRMILHDYGQETFVKAANYSALTDDRQRKQLDGLPALQR